MSEKKPYKVKVLTRCSRGTAIVFAHSLEEADDLADVIVFDDIEWDVDADFDIVSVEEIPIER